MGILVQVHTDMKVLCEKSHTQKQPSNMALSPIYKKVRVDNQTATFVQIFTSMIVLLPLIMIDGNILTIVRLDAAAVSSTILLGVLHIGVAYTMFFSLYAHMKSVEIVSYSFLEPLFDILFSIIFIGGTLTFPQIIGGFLILSSTYIGEMLKDRKLSKEKDPIQI